ncbi:TPA: FAD synthase [Candidatus Nomurabacteria bacterium]|nr:MAG: FAD synthase [Candidatus Nomurabacteria bacterium GW2011_GWE2_36_115]KKP93436.1 MAG: FAD synthase [Candidatus Nomurabacteria bacterium GW2011_GWF2_36_126]KKP96554.1 MAG: FAD synthase [Candidatus Nomurabacteria bacterium GW2011_GWD2_36_14]KKP99842.1 MAG: FAD synthase [Candidatus Nomurabacteria bacterium GW2011_GWF2_36_19]KKQ05119.1 MAG: FAD synthase [Candidatus Nomurabacteria bacterium GW2011_GWF1_36_47]KKQ09254.1 MAG: FAD synthase [Candidatus Nomurabacteria bacterium GW2011_GWB1_36_6]
MDDEGDSIIMPQIINSKKILIFGVFDGVHDGHLSFINEAKEQGGHLIAIVARDSMVEKLKGKKPMNNEVERIRNLLEIHEVDRVLLGDLDIGTYNILKEVAPDVVFLGYDQEALYENLNEFIKRGTLGDIKILKGKPHKPDTHHSSILNKK